MAKKAKRKPFAHAMMQAAPGELEEMDERKAALWSEGCVDSVTGEQRPTLQIRYVEVTDIKQLPLAGGDLMAYSLTVRTNKPLTIAEADEALRRGFVATAKTSNRHTKSAKPYRCVKCSKLAGYSIKVSVRPCPACAARKRQIDLS